MALIETITTASGQTTTVNGVTRLAVTTTGVTLSGTVVGAGGNYSLVETKTLSAASGTQTFSGLAGDTDKQYFLTGELTVSTGANIEIYPNGNTGSVMTGAYLSNTSGAPTPTSGAFTKLTMPLGSSVSSGERFAFACTIIADSRGSTFAPLFMLQILNDATGGGGAIRWQTANCAFTSKAAITSIGVAATAGNVTGRLSLYKITT